MTGKSINIERVSESQFRNFIVGINDDFVIRHFMGIYRMRSLQSPEIKGDHFFVGWVDNIRIFAGSIEEVDSRSLVCRLRPNLHVVRLVSFANVRIAISNWLVSEAIKAEHQSVTLKRVDLSMFPFNSSFGRQTEDMFL